jgi:protein-disulfide isomerase
MSETPSPTKRERRDAARAARMERERAEQAAAVRRRRLIQLGALLGAAVVIIVIAIAVSSGGGGNKTAAGGGAVSGAKEANALFAGIPQQGNTVGQAGAPVTVVEFADPQCPFCREYTASTMPGVVKDYVRPGKVKMQLRMMSFIGPDSVTAARALEAAGLQNKMWTATDILYANQGEENSGYVTDAFLKKVLGATQGLDANKALSQVNDPRVTAHMGETATMANRYGVDSTPTFLVGRGTNLKKVTGDQLRATIDAALAKSA